MSILTNLVFSSIIGILTERDFAEIIYKLTSTRIFGAIPSEMQFILSNALTAGAIGLAITIFALTPRSRERIAPFLLFTGSISSIFLLSSAIMASINFYSDIIWVKDISILFFCAGTYILPIPVIYIAFKLIRVRILIGD